MLMQRWKKGRRVADAQEQRVMLLEESGLQSLWKQAGRSERQNERQREVGKSRPNWKKRMELDQRLKSEHYRSYCYCYAAWHWKDEREHMRWLGIVHVDDCEIGKRGSSGGRNLLCGAVKNGIMAD